MSNVDVAVDVVDAASVRLSNGAVGVLASTGRLPPGSPGQHTLCVYGSRGHCILDLIAGTLTITGIDGSVESPDALPEEERYPRFAPAHNFVDVMLSGAENTAPGELGRQVVNSLDAAYRSAAAGGIPVAVED